jgi:hypothetical protein
VKADPDEWDSCQLFLFTDKGPNHNVEFFEVMLSEAKLFFALWLCYLCHRQHAVLSSIHERFEVAIKMAVYIMPIVGFFCSC